MCKLQYNYLFLVMSTIQTEHKTGITTRFAKYYNTLSRATYNSKAKLFPPLLQTIQKKMGRTYHANIFHSVYKVIRKKKMSFRPTPCPLFEAHFLKVMGATKSWIQSEKFHFLFRGRCFYLFFTGFSFMHFHSISFFQSCKHLYTGTVKVLVSREKFRFLLAFFNHNTYVTPVSNCYF